MVERARRSSREERYAYEPSCLPLPKERAAQTAYVHHCNHVAPNYFTPKSTIKPETSKSLT